MIVRCSPLVFVLRGPGVWWWWRKLEGADEHDELPNVGQGATDRPVPLGASLLPQVWYACEWQLLLGVYDRAQASATVQEFQHQHFCAREHLDQSAIETSEALDETVRLQHFSTRMIALQLTSRTLALARFPRERGGRDVPKVWRHPSDFGPEENRCRITRPSENEECGDHILTRGPGQATEALSAHCFAAARRQEGP